MVQIILSTLRDLAIFMATIGFFAYVGGYIGAYSYGKSPYRGTSADGRHTLFGIIGAVIGIVVGLIVGYFLASLF